MHACTTSWQAGRRESHPAAAVAGSSPCAVTLPRSLLAPTPARCAEVTCIEGCTCEPVRLEGHIKEQGSQTFLVVLQATPSKDCKIKVRDTPAHAH